MVYMKKFLSELKYLCYGGGTSTEDNIAVKKLPARQEKVAPVFIINYGGTGKNMMESASCSSQKSRRRLKNSHSNWKPVLSAILENNNNNNHVALSKTSKQTMMARSDVKSSGGNKRKSASPSSAASFYSDKYRKSVDPTSLPAFSPTPYVF